MLERKHTRKNHILYRDFQRRPGSGSFSLRFVALGDSLTVGFTPIDDFFSVHEFPYTAFIEQMLAEDRAEGLVDTDASFKNLGINGDTSSGMVRRFEIQVIPETPDYVIIWGGINDLYMSRNPSDVFNNLRRLCEKARESHIEPILCSLTSVRGFDYLLPKIMKVNKLIEDYCNTKKIPLVDLFSFTSDEMGKLMEVYSSDGIHLNKLGYQKVASAIYSTLKPFLSKYKRS